MFTQSNLSFYTNHNVPLIYSKLLSRKLIDHQKIRIVSPFIELNYFSRGSLFGSFLDHTIQSGGNVSILTSFDEIQKYDQIWKDFRSRDIDLRFLRKLHSKIYLFLSKKLSIDSSSSNSDLCIIGSSNFTKMGISQTLFQGNHEMNTAVSSASDIRFIESHISGLLIQSLAYPIAMRNFTKR